MKVNFLFFALFIALISYADEMDDLRDLPAPTTENMRWNIPADDWLYKDEYFLKGKYFKISNSAHVIEVEKDGQRNWKLNFYSEPSMKSNPLLSIVNFSVFYKDAKKVCERFGNEEEKYSSNYIKCEVGGCERNKDKDLNNLVNPLNNFTYSFKESITKACAYNFNYVYVRRFVDSGENSYVLFQFNKISPDKKSIEILLNGKPAYVDIRNCKLGTKESSGECGEIDYKYSRYEQNWLKLKNTQKNKSNENLNNAIVNIVPCLKNKDVKCVEKYIVRNGEEDSYFAETKITPEVFRELAACLKYENLLPHMLASRGIEKACIFNMNGGKPLLGVTFIEALSTNGIYLEDKAK